MPATLAKTAIQPLLMNGSLILPMREKASSTFVVGDLLAYTAGQVDIAGADPAMIAGIAMEDKTGTTNELVKVLIPRPGDLFRVMVYVDATAANNPTAITQLGVNYGTAKQAAGKWGVDTGETVAVIFSVIGLGADYFPNDEAVGDYYGTLICGFVPDIVKVTDTIAT